MISIAGFSSGQGRTKFIDGDENIRSLISSMRFILSRTKCVRIYK